MFIVVVALVGSAYLGSFYLRLFLTYQSLMAWAVLLLCSLGLFYLLVTIFWVRFGFQLALNRYVMKLINNIRNFCYENWLNSFDFNKIKSGIKVEEEFTLVEVIARIMSDTQSIRDLLTSGALTIVFNIIFVASCAYGFIQIDSFLGGVVVVAEVIFSIALIYGSKYMRKIFLEVRQARSSMSDKLPMSAVEPVMLIFSVIRIMRRILGKNV